MLSLLLTVAIGVVTPVEDPIPATEAYPLDICAVAGKKLGSMGKPIDFVHEGRQVRFCCRGCVPKFKANPDQYLAEVDKKIIAAQKKNYPVDYCLLSNEKLDEDAKEVVDVAREFYMRMATWSEHFSEVGKRLDKATEFYNKAVGSWERSVLPQGRKLEELDVSTNLPKTLVDQNPVADEVRMPTVIEVEEEE